MALNSSPGLYEYACHKEQMGLLGILERRQADRTGRNSSKRATARNKLKLST